MTGLVDVVAEDTNMTVFILDNATVAMTGGQQTLASGEKLIDMVKGLGVDPDHLKVIEPLSKYHEGNVGIIRREIDHPGLSVIVSKRPCIQIRK
jgi:indolepyruvate ferredoxin oxidoreductase alpha subunit